MGVLIDYFSAGSDDLAASTIDWVGGPRSGPDSRVRAGEGKRRFFGRDRSVPGAESQAHATFDVLSGRGIDPVVQIGTFEELLTGRPYDEVVADPRSGQAVAERDGGECLILTLNDHLFAALTSVSDERLTEVATPWSQTEEFWGQADAAELTEFLTELAAMARRASTKNERMYCWVCV